MVSANEPGLIRLVVENPQGEQVPAHIFRSDGAINAGKSPDGVLANLTHDKQQKIGMAGVIAKGGSRIRMMFKLDATDGIDATDCVVQLAVTEVTSSGVPISERQLSASDLGFSTDIPAATPAGSWVELGTGFLVPDGSYYRIGSATRTTPTVISIEDDTA